MANALAFGPKSPVWLANFDPSCLSWKTRQLCLVEDWGESSVTWPRSGMMRNGTAFQLPTLAPLIDATEFGLLPTPMKSGASPRKTGVWTGRYFIKPNGQKSQTRLEDVIGGRPNPTFLEWLMGFPISWTVVAPSETP